MTTQHATQQSQTQNTDAELRLSDVTKLTGLELLQAFVARKLPAPPIAKLFPIFSRSINKHNNQEI